MHYIDQNLFSNINNQIDMNKRNYLKLTRKKIKNKFEIFLMEQLKNTISQQYFLKTIKML